MNIRTAVQSVFDRVRYNRAVDRVKRPYEKTGDIYVGAWQPMDLFYRQITYALFSMFCVLLAGYLAVWALSGQMPVTVGNILAQVCLKTGECRFHVLLSGFALGNIILIYLVIFCLWSFGEMMKADTDEEKIGDAVNSVIAVLDDHTEYLNDIQYKIIQLSRGEQIAPTMLEPKPLPEKERKQVRKLCWSMITLGVVLVVVPILWVAVLIL